jgi:4-hydroxy-3-methylbut-2-enyl diphosphate reductase
VQQVRSIAGTGQAGAKNGSNSNSCAKSAPSRRFRPISYRGQGTELDLEMLRGVTIGLTAGAPAPEILVGDVIEASSALGPIESTTLPGVAEYIEFKLPAERNG